MTTALTALASAIGADQQTLLNNQAKILTALGERNLTAEAQAKIAVHDEFVAMFNFLKSVANSDSYFSLYGNFNTKTIGGSDAVWRASIELDYNPKLRRTEIPTIAIPEALQGQSVYVRFAYMRRTDPLTVLTMGYTTQGLSDTYQLPKATYTYPEGVRMYVEIIPRPTDISAYLNTFEWQPATVVSMA